MIDYDRLVDLFDLYEDGRFVNRISRNRSQNNCNSQRPTGESGLRGAYLDKRNLQWYSKIQFGGQVKFLGNFSSAEEAHLAFEAVAEILHRDFYVPPQPSLGL